MSTSLYKSRLIAFKHQNGRCFYCDYPIWLESPNVFTEKFGISKKAALRFRCTAEHLIARQDGGKDSRENIVAACSFCNMTRHRFPTPPDPAIYQRHVMQRVRSGKWHHKEFGHLSISFSRVDKESVGWCFCDCAVAVS